MDFKLDCEIIHLKYYDNITNYNPNFSINSTENNLYKFENVVNYAYQFCKPEIIIKYRKNKYILNNDNKSYYLVMDCLGKER